MLTIIGSLIGFLGSFAPEMFNFFRDKKDKEHELKLINLQIEAAKANRHSKLEAVKLQTEAEESKYLYLHAAPSKVKWVDGLAALVRPLVTFMFVLSYIYFKHKYQGTLAWTEEDQGIFNTVICFWFGNRAVNKYKK